MTGVLTYGKARLRTWDTEALSPWISVAGDAESNVGTRSAVYTRDLVPAATQGCSITALYVRVANREAVPLPDVRPRARATFVGQRVVRVAKTSKADELLPPISVAVNQLVSALSLTVSQAARIFGITRPTVYAWRRAEGHVKIEDTNQKRLVQIFGLFREWDRKSLGPLGERAHVPFLSDHRSIVDLLSGDLLDEATLAEVRNRLELLAAKDRENVLVGEKAARWREAIGSEPLSGEALDSNLESNLRARKDVD